MGHMNRPADPASDPGAHQFGEGTPLGRHVAADASALEASELARSPEPGRKLASELMSARGAGPTWAVLGRAARRLRATPVYLLAVIATATVLNHVLTQASREHVIKANSTNVQNLSHHRYWVLVSSLFLVDGRASVLSVLLLLIILGTAELLWGPWRLAGVLLAGNVVASMLVYAGLRVGIRHNWFAGSVSFASDVGTSYGSHAVAGALIMTLPTNDRRLLIAAVLILGVAPILLSHTFTDVGHLLSLAIGLTAGGLFARRRALSRG